MGARGAQAGLALRLALCERLGLDESAGRAGSVLSQLRVALGRMVGLTRTGAGLACVVGLCVGADRGRVEDGARLWLVGALGGRTAASRGDAGQPFALVGGHCNR